MTFLPLTSYMTLWPRPLTLCSTTCHVFNPQTLNVLVLSDFGNLWHLQSNCLGCTRCGCCKCVMSHDLWTWDKTDTYSKYGLGDSALDLAKPATRWLRVLVPTSALADCIDRHCTDHIRTVSSPLTEQACITHQGWEKTMFFLKIKICYFFVFVVFYGFMVFRF